MKICECCGHPLPEEKGVTSKLTGTELLIFLCIKKAGTAGINGDGINERLSSGRRDGGASVSNVHVLMKRVKKKIKEHGLEIISEPRGIYARYYLREIKNDPV